MVEPSKSGEGPAALQPPLVLSISVDRNSGQLSLANNIGAEAVADLRLLVQATQRVLVSLQEALVEARVGAAVAAQSAPEATQNE